MIHHSLVATASLQLYHKIESYLCIYNQEARLGSLVIEYDPFVIGGMKEVMITSRGFLFISSNPLPWSSISCGGSLTVMV